ncbi:MAG: hypothetical protein K1Y02_26535, partial [Candidatus Hydrogenedentes bacterium]|nr:hypothetical protein [Candidatus Hydrogenedentota bacterium]
MHYLARALTLFTMFVLLMPVAGAQDQPASAPPPENLYQTDLLSFPGPWAFELGKSGIILVEDQQLDDLTDPDKEVDLGLTGTPNVTTLRAICERAQAAKQRTLILAFDHFFSQYRGGVKDAVRKYMPDRDATIERIAKISGFAQQYGLGLELSLLSPLEIGSGYRDATGESGMWLHYRKGLRDATTGTYSVQLWRNTLWSNNKGSFNLEDAGVRVFAFRQRNIGGTPFVAVNPDEIVEISDTAKVDVWPGALVKQGDFSAVRVRIHGEGRADIGPLDRVLVVQQYRTPEMDYFSPNALPFLTGLMDKYLNAGVKLNALYSDEMHIQQDWHYFTHHDNGEFALRYVTPNLSREYAARYGAAYADLAKYMLFFTYGQEDTSNTIDAKNGISHVFGDSPEDIRKTALFRARYFHLLQDSVVDLFAKTKRYTEQRIGYQLEARAHATWAQSPTIDKWEVGRQNHPRNQYEYTSNFIWSNTVQQASAACYDYFKWGDFLTGNGNDHAEGGWLDRDYYGLMLACSTGIINRVPYSYGAHWGMPNELSRRRQSLVNVFGAAASPDFAIVEDAQHRDVNVLMLYPIDLVSVEERFGSWMTQYAYTNLITPAKLLELGRVEGNSISICGRHFTTLATLFEPFPSKALLALMQQFVEGGGRLIWSGPPPVLTAEAENTLDAWQQAVAVDYKPGLDEGQIAPGRVVSFEGPLSAVPSQTILTDFLVDRIYPVTPKEGATVVARVGNDVVGTHRALPSGGSITFLGFRPRDDQSASLGYETRTWFATLDALGAYPGTGKFTDTTDNTEYLSRTTDYLACRFPNGTVAITNHLKSTLEDWPGGFARKDEQDSEYLRRVPPPSETLKLRDLKVNGHTVTYDGEQAVAFRQNENGVLQAFSGSQCASIVLDGNNISFASQPMAAISWAPVTSNRRVPGGAVLIIHPVGTAELQIPAPEITSTAQLYAEGQTRGTRGASVPCTVQDGVLRFTVTP